MLYWGFVMPNTAWIRVSSDCAFAKLKDGTQVKAKWSQLKTLDTVFRSTRLKFTGHPLICLPQPRWSGIPRPALRVAREKSLGTPLPVDADGISRKGIIRIGVYCLAAAIAGGWLIHLAPLEARRVNGIEAFALLLRSFGMIWGILAALALLPPALAKKCARWQRRRRRAGLNASSSGR